MIRAIPLLLALIPAACGKPSSPAADPAGDGNSAVVAADAPAAPGPPAAPEPAPIPTQFHGLWAESQQACGQLNHPSRLVISDRTLSYPDFVLKEEEVSFPTDNSFAVKGRSTRSDAPAEAHFSIDVTRTLLTDEAGGGTVRMRCG